MRIFLVFIVILNLLYAGWEFISPNVVNNAIAPMPDNLKSLELLHEIESPALQAEESIEVVEAEAEAQDIEPREIESDIPVSKSIEELSCYTLGPFKDQQIMQQLRESIAEYVTNISVRKRQESEKHRYWVYVPAQVNRKQAKLMAKKLREKQLNDFYIVLSGSAKNSISLGHFREPKYANRRMKQVVDEGFEAEIKVIYRDYDIYWLDYQVKTTSGEPDFSADEYVSDGVTQLVRDCNT